MIRCLVAMPREAEAFGIPCEVIGIGGTDIPEIEPTDIIVNVGYCGASQIPVGTVVEPRLAISAEEGGVKPLKPSFDGLVESAPCITAKEFVTKPMTDRPAIYDMELWKLANIPCKRLVCLKIVSDNLNEGDCEEFSGRDPWEKVRALLKGAGVA